MGLKEILDKFFRKQESLDAFLIPRDHMMRGILPSDAPRFFDLYAIKMQDALEEVYAKPFDREIGVREPSFQYQYTSPNFPLRASYTVGPIVQSRSFNSQGVLEGPSIYAGIFHVEQTPLDLPDAGRLFERLAAHYLLAWSENESFQVFHYQGKKTVAEKEGLLRQLGISPSDAAVYHVFPGAVFWARQDFSKQPTNTVSWIN